jgi:hypothetical protein
MPYSSTTSGLYLFDVVPAASEARAAKKQKLELLQRKVAVTYARLTTNLECIPAPKQPFKYGSLSLLLIVCEI